MHERQNAKPKAWRKTQTSLLLASLMVLTALLATAQGAEKASKSGGKLKWSHDLEAAKKQAAKEGKDLLIDFTGSDWCGWCIKLVDEVFSKEEFQNAAPKQFIFVEIDFPRDKSGQSEELQATNKKLQKEYGVTGFPSIFLTDAKGVPYAKTGYKAGGPENYLKQMAEFREKNVQKVKLLAKAAPLKGVEKAKALDAAMAVVQEDLLYKYYDGIVKEIIALDADNKAGLKAKYGLKQKEEVISAALRARDYKKAIELSEAFIKENKLTPEQTQDAYFNVSTAHFSLKKKDAALDALRKSRDAAPNTPTATRIKGIIKKYFPEAAENKETK